MAARPARACPPTLRVAQPYEHTDGDLACDFVARCTGERADPEQLGVMRDWLAREGPGPSAPFTHTLNYLEAPRQNVKSFLFRARAIVGAALYGERVLYTAHNYDTTCEMRDILFDLFGRRRGDPKAGCRSLNRRVRRVASTNGHESIKLANGGAIYFSTRTKSAKRGYTVDVILVDEAQELREEQQKAIVGTASAAPLGNPQFIFAGTPPTPECYGDVFQVKRDELAAGVNSDDDLGAASLNEWSASDIPGFTLADVANRDHWYATNLALGRRIKERTMAAEFALYTDPLSFAQEHLGYWLPRQSVNSVIKPDEWAACSVDARGAPEPTGDDVLALAVRFSTDGTTCSLAACSRAPDGRPHAELLPATGPMTRGLDGYVAFVAERFDRYDRVVVSGKASSTDMVERLRAAGCAGKRLVVPSTAEDVAAYSGLLNATRERAFTHLASPLLDLSATGCPKRAIGRDGGWGFADSGEAQACHVEAVAQALWVCGQVKRHRKPHDGKVRIGC